MTSGEDVTFWTADTVLAMSAVAATVIASVSLLVTAGTLYVQRSHNRKSVLPIAEFILGDYEDQLEVALVNKGFGPLIVQELVVSGKAEAAGDLVSLMPTMPSGMAWSSFTGNVTRRCLSAGERVSILKLDGAEDDQVFLAYRDEVRGRLANLEVKLRYTDIYSSNLPVKNRSLEWFGRNLDTSA